MAGRRVSEERQGRTPNARRYSALATSDLARGDHEAAARNLQMALTFEPENAWFKEQLSRSISKIVRSHWNRDSLCRHRDRRGAGTRPQQLHVIAETRGHHESVQQVIAVISLADDPQVKVDF